MPIGSTHSPTLIHKRMMVFVDGSNFLCEFAKELGVKFRAVKPPAEAIEAAKWLFRPMCDSRNWGGEIKLDVIRSYWFSSYQGNGQYGEGLREILRKNHFEPVIFKQKPDGREKSVDIALAKEMLVNAFNQNFDIGLLIAGDEDYSGLVNEVKRYGPVVWVSFFSSRGLSSSLRIAADMFIDIMSDFRAAEDQNYIKARDELCKLLVMKKKVATKSDKLIGCLRIECLTILPKRPYFFNRCRGVVVDQRKGFWVARAQRTVNQLDQALTSCGNPGQLKSFVDGLFELSAHLVVTKISGIMIDCPLIFHSLVDSPCFNLLKMSNKCDTFFKKIWH